MRFLRESLLFENDTPSYFSEVNFNLTGHWRRQFDQDYYQ